MHLCSASIIEFKCQRYFLFTSAGCLQANSEKQRLEVKQRAARKAADEGVPLEPRWFDKVPNSVPGETPAFQYAGGYWEARKTGNWEGCRDIFGPAL